MKPAGTENNSPKGDASIQEIGLCGRCAHAIPTPGPRSTFLRCGLAGTDDFYPRYPLLPVRSCPGFDTAALDRGALVMTADEG